jgi:DNA (cytosine-5)-methyltransferase 1
VHRGKCQVAQSDALLTDAVISGARQHWVSMRDALNAASQLEDSRVDTSRFHMNGRTDFFVVSNYGSGGDPKKRGRRLASEPAFTVTGKISRNKIYRSIEEFESGRSGRFTPAESGVLQTFPHNFPWSGKDQAQQIGNAVPPRLGMHVLGMALRGEPPTEEELSAASTWPIVSRTTSNELRLIGCGDQSKCPAGSHKITRSQRTSALGPAHRRTVP